MVKRWDEIIESLKTYRTITGKDDFISQSYVIPSSTQFPLHLHGIKLGKLLHGARKAFHKKQLTRVQIQTLEEHQMYWDYEAFQSKQVSLLALDSFKKIKGHVWVPIIPPFSVRHIFES